VARTAKVELREYSLTIKYSINVPDAALRFTTEQAITRHIAILAAAGATSGVTPETEIYIRKGSDRLPFFAFIDRMLQEHNEVLRREGKTVIAVTEWILEGEADQLPLEFLELAHGIEAGELPTAVGIAELLLEGLVQRARNSSVVFLAL